MNSLPPARSRLLALVLPFGSQPAISPIERFRDLFGCEPSLHLGHPSSREAGDARPGGPEVLVYTGGQAAWATEPAGRFTVAVHGEAYGMPDPSPQALARGFAERGLAYATSLGGSYALLVHDAAQGRAWAITDRPNSRWLFHGRDGRAHVLTTEMAAQPVRGADVDPVALAWYLSSGIAVAGRTLYHGVRIVDGASTLPLDVEDPTPEAYWSYSARDRCEGFPPARLEDDLFDLMSAAVRRTFSEDDRLLISLSVGWDLTALLGILMKERGTSALESFTYANGDPQVGSDAALALTLASRWKLRHRTLESYEGDLVSHIAANAWFGGGMANVCDEIDAWRTLGAEIAGAADAVIVTGDQRFGGADLEFSDEAAVLRKVGLRPLRLPIEMLAAMPEPSLSRMIEGMEEDRATVLETSRRCENLHDWHDTLRYDQRLRLRIMPWRDRFATRFAPVRAPFLDNELIEFVSGLPTAMRRGKSLFKRVATSRFPELYQGPRARVAGYEMDLESEIRRHSDRLRETVLAGESRLDDWIPPAAVSALFHAAGGQPRSMKERTTVGRMRLGHLARRVQRRLGRASHGLKPRQAARLFRRVAVLREALRP